MRYTILSLILLAGTANAETFYCQAGTYWVTAKRVVIATINEDGKTGTIKVAGVLHEAQYSIQGFNRRWDFGLQDDGTFHYAFKLMPDGTAVYYDFSRAEVGEIVQPSQWFVCK